MDLERRYQKSIRLQNQNYLSSSYQLLDQIEQGKVCNVEDEMVIQQD